MFTVLGQRTRHRCDGGSRRSFLKAGSLGLAGMTLADVLQAEHAAGQGASQKAVINIHLDGGPPQMDLIDPKPEAPSEYRSPFSSIPTVIPWISCDRTAAEVGLDSQRIGVPAVLGGCSF